MQALIILGLFVLLLVVSCSRQMAINLVAFLRDLRNVILSGDPGNRRMSNKARSRSQKRSRLSRKLSELGGAQAREQQPSA